MDQKIKIMDLTLWTPVDTDFIPFVDVSDTTQSAAGSTKRALKSELKWDTGDNATATAWTTTTGVPWSSANVTNVWTTSDAIFNFTIPRWDVWSQGIQGIQGIQWVAGTDWESFTWLGAYSGATGYVVNDVVSYNGSSYICILESTGNLPTNVTYWAVMALKGTDGIGTGDVVWPASSVNNNVATFDGTTWKLIKDSWLSLSGTNTWDETTATIKSKLSITTLSGSNTGDQTSIVGITWTLAQFNTACTDADFATWWGTATGSNTGDNSPNTNSWLVHTTGTETIAGVKTFSSPLITNWAINFNAPEGFMVNGKIVPTVASGNLTVALKTLAGTDPSATDPIYTRVNNAIRTITSACTITINNNDFYNFNSWSAELATKEVDYFVYLSTFGWPLVSRCSHFGLVSEWVGGWEKSIANTGWFSTESINVIWRFTAIKASWATGNWSIPTYTASNLIQRAIYNAKNKDLIPQLSTGTAMTFTGTWVSLARYSIEENHVTCYYTFNGTIWGTLNRYIRASTPFIPANWANIYRWIWLYEDASGNALPCEWYIDWIGLINFRPTSLANHTSWNNTFYLTFTYDI